jgi:hypothetical protein
MEETFMTTIKSLKELVQDWEAMWPSVEDALILLEKAKTPPPPKERPQGGPRGPFTGEPAHKALEELAKPRQEADVPFHVEQFLAKLLGWVEAHSEPAVNDDVELTRIHVLRDRVMEVYTMMGDDMRVWAYFKGKLDDALEEIELMALEKAMPITFGYFIGCLNRVIKELTNGEDICEG